jgi:hypothetical protein
MVEEFANELMSRDVIFGEIEYRRCKPTDVIYMCVYNFFVFQIDSKFYGG